jgi:hypothetical protein
MGASLWRAQVDDWSFDLRKMTSPEVNKFTRILIEALKKEGRV